MFRLFLLSAALQAAIASFSTYLQIALRNKGYAHSLVGILMAVSQLAAIMIPLAISVLADRSGRAKRYIVLSGICALIASLPFFLSENVAIVVVSLVFLNGFIWCMNPLSDGFINRKVSGDSSQYGIIRAFGTLSYVAVLSAFAILSFPDEGNNSSIMRSFLLFISIFIAISAIQRDYEGESRKEKKSFSLSMFSGKFYLYMVIVALLKISISVIDKLLPSYMTEELGLGSHFTAFIALGALFEFFSMIIFGRLLDKGRFSGYSALFISAIALVVRFSLFLIPGIIPFAIAETLHGLTFGVLHVGALRFISDNSDPADYEVAATVYWAAASNLPGLFASLFGGLIIDNYGFRTLFGVSLIFPIIAMIIASSLKNRLTATASCADSR